MQKITLAAILLVFHSIAFADSERSFTGFEYGEMTQSKAEFRYGHNPEAKCTIKNQLLSDKAIFINLKLGQINNDESYYTIVTKGIRNENSAIIISTTQPSHVILQDASNVHSAVIVSEQFSDIYVPANKVDMEKRVLGITRGCESYQRKPFDSPDEEFAKLVNDIFGGTFSEMDYFEVTKEMMERDEEGNYLLVLKN